MELGRQRLEVSVLGETMLCVVEAALVLALQGHLRRTHHVGLGDEVVPVNAF